MYLQRVSCNKGLHDISIILSILKQDEKLSVQKLIRNNILKLINL